MKGICCAVAVRQFMSILDGSFLLIHTSEVYKNHQKSIGLAKPGALHLFVVPTKPRAK